MAQPGPRLKLLWIIDFDYSTRHHHGATLRFFNYSRQLIARGHRVYFVFQKQSEDIRREAQFFEGLKADGVLTAFYACSYSAPRWKRRFAGLTALPSLADALLAAEQHRTFAYCRGLAKTLEIDVCLFSSSELVFLSRRFQPLLPVIIDIADSATFYRLREARLLWQRRALAPMLTSLRYLAESYLKERHYSGLADATIAVSPVDKSALDRITNRPQKNYVLLNGVSPGTNTAKIQKIKGRLIFSGNMNFPPNYESAIWLIDHVLPKVLAADPDAHLVIAGANPVRELSARTNDRIHITGFVGDMATEIAASSLYVAPMIMGGGFKNKVVEALINRTYVAGTSMSVEFLGQDVVNQMLIADSAESLAHHIIRFLSRPEDFETRLDALHTTMLHEFSWEHRTSELLDIVRDVLQKRARVAPPGRAASLDVGPEGFEPSTKGL